MTENEAIERIKSGICNEIGTAKYCHDNCMHGIEHCAYSMAIQALEEIQAYRSIGTVEELMSLKENCIEPASIRLYLTLLEKYRAIGTVEEFKALKEKKSEWKYSRKENIATCKNCSYEHYLGTYHQYATNYCPKCGSKMHQLDWQ